MAELKTNLLSAEDIAFIQEHGISETPQKDLFIRSADDSLVLTIKGRQYVRYVCHVYSLDYSELSLSTDLEVLRFANKVNFVILKNIDNQIAEELRSHSILPQSREHAQAYLSGNLDASLGAAKRLNECASAGAHVIPVHFGL